MNKAKAGAGRAVEHCSSCFKVAQVELTQLQACLYCDGLLVGVTKGYALQKRWVEPRPAFSCGMLAALLQVDLVTRHVARAVGVLGGLPIAAVLQVAAAPSPWKRLPIAGSAFTQARLASSEHYLSEALRCRRWRCSAGLLCRDRVTTHQVTRCAAR